MRIALDVMGGDYAPHINVKGAVLAKKKWNIPITLVGDRNKILKQLQRNKISPDSFEIVHASDAIGMHDSIASVKSRKDASINVAFELLKEKKVDAVVSPGHSGAFMASALLTVGRIPGILRPAITGLIPSLGSEVVMLDIGANVDCKPSHLIQFAMMGSVYSRLVRGIPNPKIGLLSNGTEETKGNELIRTVHEQLKNKNFNYVGFVESKDVFKNKVDVVVCDGFDGNLFLKTAESVLSTALTLFRTEIERSFLSKASFYLFALCARSAFQKIRRRFDYAEYGAAPLLGMNGLGFVCHGASSASAISNALKTASLSVESGFLRELNEEIRKMDVVE